MKRYSFLVFAAAVAFMACSKSSNPPASPDIVIDDMFPNVIQSGSPKDTLIIVLRYTMSGEHLASKPTVNIVDSRLDTFTTSIPFPDDIEVRKEVRDKPVSGSITVKLDAGTFLVGRPDYPLGDTLKYTIDVSIGNAIKSNTVETNDIYITP